VHCVSDNEVVVMQLHEHSKEPIGYWSVDDVKKISIGETSPWTAAESLVEFLGGPRIAALQ
jgi:hypothetical protein